MKKLLIGLLVFGLTTQFMFAQIIELSEVTVSVNYKYLDAIDSEEAAIPVQMLREKVAFYNLKESELYSDEFDTYAVSFYIPEGKIVAAYDDKGRILRTIERFKDVKLPRTVLMAVTERYPNWTITKDFYKVNYHNNKGITKNEYKVKLKNGDKSIVVKVDNEGEFL